MRILSTKEAVDNLIRVLLHSGKKRETTKWQAVEHGKEKMVEVCDLFVKMRMTNHIENIASETRADLPWAEEHFQERISGVASNPGEQYKNWPYWKPDPKFMQDGKFSHTYQERFWPDTGFDGVRCNAGNYADVAHRLAKDNTTRQAFLSIWHPVDQANNGVRVPCTIGYWFKVRDGRLDITYLIRSCDARRHLRNDVYMAQRLAMDVLSYEGMQDIKLGIMSMWIGSLHCFESDLYSLVGKLSNVK